MNVPQAHWQEIVPNCMSINTVAKTILAIGMTDAQIEQDSTPEEWRVWQEKVTTFSVFDSRIFDPVYAELWFDYYGRMALLKMPAHDFDFAIGLVGLPFYRFRYSILFPGYEMIEDIKRRKFELLLHRVKCKSIVINAKLL